jgi:hypothetical protein
MYSVNDEPSLYPESRGILEACRYDPWQQAHPPQHYMVLPYACASPKPCACSRLQGLEDPHGSRIQNPHTKGCTGIHEETR